MIYIDMDGVVADFKSLIVDVTGEDKTTSEFWRELSEMENPYYWLPVLKDAKKAIKEIKNLAKYNRKSKPQFLTSLPIVTGNLVTAQRDKVEWIHNHIGKYQVNVVHNWRHKKNFVFGACDILVDDSERNCNDWVKAGGQAILHTSFENTLKILELML